MPAAIDFHYDYSSPYGYFAATRIEALAARHGRQVTWRPLLLGVVFKVSGGAPLPSLPLKGDYGKRDIPRFARLLGVPFRMPSKFPVSGTAASRATLWVRNTAAERTGALTLALYRAFFVDDRDISSPEVVAEVAATAGFDRAAVLAAINDGAIKDQLKNEVEAAIAAGVFGSPFVVIDGEPFWGADRLDQVERWLATGGW